MDRQTGQTDTHLVGEAVQGPGQPVHSSSEGEVGVRQRAAHQVTGVGADVAPFVVTVGPRSGVRSPHPTQGPRSPTPVPALPLPHTARCPGASHTPRQSWAEQLHTCGW